jgi:hypothetical protein
MSLLKSLARIYWAAILDVAPYVAGLTVLVMIAGLAPAVSAFLAALLAVFVGLSVNVIVDFLRGPAKEDPEVLDLIVSLLASIEGALWALSKSEAHADPKPYPGQLWSDGNTNDL